MFENKPFLEAFTWTLYCGAVCQHLWVTQYSTIQNTYCTVLIMGPEQLKETSTKCWPSLNLVVNSQVYIHDWREPVRSRYLWKCRICTVMSPLALREVARKQKPKLLIWLTKWWSELTLSAFSQTKWQIHKVSGSSDTEHREKSSLDCGSTQKKNNVTLNTGGCKISFFHSMIEW